MKLHTEALTNIFSYLFSPFPIDESTLRDRCKLVVKECLLFEDVMDFVCTCSHVSRAWRQHEQVNEWLQHTLRQKNLRRGLCVVPEIDRFVARQTESTNFLHMAFSACNFEAMKVVIERVPSCINVPDKMGETVLYKACRLSQIVPRRALVKFLLSSKAEPDAWCGRRGAAQVGRVPSSLSGDFCDYYNVTTCLNRAAEHFDAELCGLLLSHKAEINNSLSTSPLLRAVMLDRDEGFKYSPNFPEAQVSTIKLLLRARANPDGCLVDNEQPLPLLGDRGSCWHAAQTGNLKVLKVLVEYRADPFKSDGFGDDALAIAHQNDPSWTSNQKKFLKSVANRTREMSLEVAECLVAEACSPFLQSLSRPW